MIVASSLACRLVVLALDDKRLAKVLVRLFVLDDSPPAVVGVDDDAAPPEEKNDEAGGSIDTR